MSPDLARRLAIAPFLIALVFGALILDINTGTHYGALGVALLAALVGCFELVSIMRREIPGSQRTNLFIVTILLVLSAFPPLLGVLDLPPAINPPMLVLGLAVVLVGLRQMARFGPRDFLPNVGSTMLGILYLGVPIHLLVAMACDDTHGTARGTQLMIIMLATCKLGDVTAYFGGRAFGKHKMSPSISPGKTWEGFAASFVGSVGGAYAVTLLVTGSWLPMPFSSWWHPLLWGLLLGPAGVAGDLLESCIKRAVSVKDSGNFIPGFGGVLDLLDALILAAPIAYLLAQIP